MASVIQYVGRKTTFKGKTLWEIVGNLKGGGVGRIITRSMFERYPEPSFYKILKVEHVPYEKPRKVKVLVEKTFRGKTSSHNTLIFSASYKADYRLIPKDEEEAYCKIPENLEAAKKITPFLEFPPLMKLMLLRDKAKKNIQPPENFCLTQKVSKSLNSMAKLMSEKETTEVMPIGIGIPDKPLYKNVKPIKLEMEA